MSVFRTVLRLLACLVLLGPCAPARADTAITLWKSFNGAVNFTGTQATLRTSSNNVNACSVASSTSNRSGVLSLPTGATVLSAQLYWAGSGSADNTVTFQGNSVTATRKYSSATVGNGMNYFGGAADVTDIVKNKGAGTYTFSGLTVASGNPWCASQAVLGGFSLLVVYSHPNEAERVLNLYEGFRFFQNGEITFTATNFRWPRPWWPTREKARVGHITWEGDSTLSQGGENLIFEGNELTDDMNPSGNQFNSRSNINRDYNSYGIDFDAYDTEVVQWIFFDPSVTTTYRTGQDLVLLNAEILVVPTLPVSDLSIAMTRGGATSVGGKATYTLVVSNNGPYTEAGPITVTNTLPAGMSFISASGVNWTCTNSGQVVTCTYKPSMAPNTTAAPLVITAAVNQSGSMTNNATVAGTADNNSANNSVSNTFTATGSATATPGYVFTSVPCAPGKTVDSADCPLYNGPMIGGGSAKIYVTAVNGTTTMTLNATQQTAVPMQFSLSCEDPASGKVGAGDSIAPGYAGVALKRCTPNGAAPAAGADAWSGTVNMVFAANSASAAVTAGQSNFGYPDVGTVQLNLLANGRVASSNSFTARPLRLAFRSITNASGGLNPGATTPDGTGFARAGENFSVDVGALLFDGQTFAPNFGNERTTPTVSFMHAAAADETAPMNVAGELTSSPNQVAKNGAIGATLQYSEVGAVNIVPSLADYQATGLAVGGRREVVGRFYPAYYTTTVTAPSQCQMPMGCESAPAAVSGAAYSGQSFDVEVKAYNLAGDKLENYVGTWRKPVTLGAVTAPGQGATARALIGGELGSDAGIARLAGAPNFTLEVPFDVSRPANTAWSAPLPIYLRATSPETVAVPKTAASSNGVKAVSISSLRDDPAQSAEDGVMIVNGRMNVGSAQGSNIRRTPLRLQVQYWSGAAWVNHADIPNQAYTAAASYTSCWRDLRAGSANPTAGDTGLQNCNAALLNSPTATQNVALTAGAGIYLLNAPGAGRAGSVWVQPTGHPWLPATRGRVNFGTTRSPLIYLREVY